jgi:DNA anti-recombination protein RmuC
MNLLLAFLSGAATAAIVLALLRRGARRSLEAVAELREAVQALHLDQRREAGELRGLVGAFVGQQEQIVRQTGQLSEALRRPSIRGRWGETTLREVVEAAGLVEHFDFDTQSDLAADEDHVAARPDLIVRLPGGGCVPVDAKAPLDAYLDGVAAKLPANRERALDARVRQVRSEVREVSGKRYWARLPRAAEMVVMFLATELIGRLATFATHVTKVGKALDQAANANNQAVGSLESRVLVTARKFGDLGVPADLPDPGLVATIPRLPSDIAGAPHTSDADGTAGPLTASETRPQAQSVATSIRCPSATKE